MTSNCSGCGGVVGRDCFNPQECEWIAQDMQHQAVLQEEHNWRMRNDPDYGRERDCGCDPAESCATCIEEERKAS